MGEEGKCEYVSGTYGLGASGRPRRGWVESESSYVESAEHVAA